jgi:hypothetical protein
MPVAADCIGCDKDRVDKSMKRILIPTESFEDWQRLVARPELHWKAGASAMTIARAWEAAAGVPPEVRRALNASSEPALRDLEPLLIVPEYKIPLPGGSRASQSDVFVLARGQAALVAIVVEGKVDEPFGPTVGERRADPSEGLEERYGFLLRCLGLEQVADSIRYQLLHRAASAVLAAEEFFAPYAVMLVHSFSPNDKWFEDFAQFAAMFGSRPKIGAIVPARRCGKTELFLGWCKGDQQFRVHGQSAV